MLRRRGGELASPSLDLPGMTSELSSLEDSYCKVLGWHVMIVHKGREAKNTAETYPR